jgi:2-C-methyl-D-erythritol 4-phosphate cytidylyltransferase/2-C-methyl-D-erythritol 2,4-cyclodiphosphate synthase
VPCRPAERSAQDWVLVHDAARCLVTPEQIDALIDACAHDSVGGLLAHKLADTLKTAIAGPGGVRVASTVDRSDKWLAQTPQMFRIGPQLMAALEHVGSAATDEASAMEAMGLHPRLVPGSALNFKVTYPEDFALAQAVLAQRGHGATLERLAGAGPGVRLHNRPCKGTGHMNFRIGEGWDVHALVPGRRLVIGGVEIPHTLGLLGHSDADVLLHAITDALLGAAGLGDIGTHFPDTDAQFRGAGLGRAAAGGCAPCACAGLGEMGNIDSTVVAQAPRLAAHIPAMRARIAQVLDLAPEQVNIKAKTAERLGPVGQCLAIEARAVALLLKA